MLSPDAERVTLDIMYDYENQEGPFEDIESSILPVESVMKEMEFEHERERATYLTLSTSLNFMRSAETLRQRTKGLWETENWIYQPANLLEEERYDDLFDLFKGRGDYEDHPVLEEHGLMEYGKKDVDIWFTNAATLYEEHDSNPISLFESFDYDAREIFDHVQNETRRDYADEQITFSKRKFPYLGGPKIGPLWLRLVDDLVKSVDLERVDFLPLPVDRQIVKVTNFLEGTDYPLQPTEQDKEEIRRRWEPFCKPHGYSTAEIDDALWRIGEEENWDDWGQNYLDNLMGDT